MKLDSLLLGTSLLLMSTTSACAGRSNACFEVILQGGPSSTDEKVLHIPEEYISLEIDAKHGKRNSVTIGVGLSDMGPAREVKKGAYREAAEADKYSGMAKATSISTASVNLKYEPREDLVQVNWESLRSRFDAKLVSTDRLLQLDQYGGGRLPENSDLFWASEIPAYAECMAGANRCSVNTYLSNGIYARFVVDRSQLGELRNVRLKLIELAQRFLSNCEELRAGTSACPNLYK